MDYDISQPIPQGSDGAQDAEDSRIAAIANELERLCAIHEAQSGDSQQNVSRFETEQRTAEQMAKSQGFWIPMMELLFVFVGLDCLRSKERGLGGVGGQNRSEWVPVPVNKSVSSVSFCSQIRSQSGFRWHSQQPLYGPDNLCGRYVAGSVPVSPSNATASLSSRMS